MKNPTRWIFALLALVTVVGGLWSLHRYLKRPRYTDPVKTAWAKEASPSVAFVVNHGGSVTYSIPRGTSKLRLLVNANLSPGVLQEYMLPPSPDRARPFSVVIDELGFWSRKLNQRNWTILSQVGLFRDTRTNVVRPSLFYLDQDWVPANTYEILLDFSGNKNARSIRVHLGDVHADIKDVVCRAYTPSTASTYRVKFGWERLSDPTRTQLLAGNVYPARLLREDEKNNLMASVWHPLAPDSFWGRGVPHRDLYQSLEAMDPEVGVHYKPYGLAVDATRTALIPLPMAGGRVLLRCAASDILQPGNSAHSLGVTWIGYGLGNRNSRRYPWKRDQLEVEGVFQGGYLVVDANRAGNVRAWLRNKDGDKEITPPDSSLSCTLVKSGQEVVYDLPPAAGRTIPFRLDARTMLANPDSSTARVWLYRQEILARWNMANAKRSPARYSVLDVAGKVMVSGQLPLDSALSTLDDLPNDFGNLRVSLPTATYILLPPAARQVRVWLESPDLSRQDPVLITAYNRPPDMPWERAIPDDFYAFDTQKTRIPAWFPLRPADFESLVRDKRWVPLTTQPLQDTGDEELLQGLYEVDPLRLEQNAVGLELMVPRDPIGIQPRVDGLPSYYREIQPGQDTAIEFQTRPGLQTVSPSLYWVGDGQPATFDLELDGKSLVKGVLGAAIREILCPPVRAGKHQLRLITHGQGKAYINHVWPTPSDWVKRFAYPARPGQTFTFTHDRSTRNQEVFCLNLWGKGGSSAIVTAKIIGQGRSAEGAPLPYLTAMERRFTIRPARGRSSVVLSGGKGRLDAGQVAAVTMGADLPPGRYKIQITLDAGSECCVAMTQTQVGLREKVLLNQESQAGSLP